MIGRATAVKLAKQDFDILIHTGGKSLAEAKKTSEMISALSKKCEIVTGDLTDLKTIESIKNKAHEMGNPLVQHAPNQRSKQKRKRHLQRSKHWNTQHSEQSRL